MMRGFYKIMTILMLIVALAGYDLKVARQGHAASAPVTSLKFSGTFLQLVPEAHSQWTLARWSRLFSYFNDLGVRRLIIQWSAFNAQDSFPFGRESPAICPELETILALADQFQISLYVGLTHDAAYWNRIEQDASSVRTYLRRLIRKNLQLAKVLTSSVNKHQSFSGWYITEEIDDVNWNTTEKRDILIEYLQILSNRLQQLTPGKSVALSGFSNAALSPLDLTEFWYEILAETGIDEVLFQDGIGVNKLTLNQLPDYFAAVLEATKRTHKKFHVIIEVFQQIAGTPINDQAFKAVSVGPERVQAQMQIASVYSSELWAFSIPEYMTPEAGDVGRSLYEYFRLQPDPE